MGAPLAQHGAHHWAAPLDGVRVLANASVMIFHFFMVYYIFWVTPLGKDPNAELQNAHPIVQFMATNGLQAVDWFFVISGMLAALSLVPALEDPQRPAWRVVASYYRRRLLRLLPGHLAALAATYAMLAVYAPGLAPDAAAGAGLSAALRGDAGAGSVGVELSNTFLARWFEPERCAANAPFVLGFLSNYFGLRVCNIVLWSLDVQMHFFAIFPLLLLALRPRAPGFRLRVAATCIAAVVATGVARVAVTLAQDVPFPCVLFGQTMDDVLRNAAHLVALYCPTHMRVAPLFAGAAAALPLLGRSPGSGSTPGARDAARAWLEQRPRLVAVVTALSVAVVAAGAAPVAFTDNPARAPGVAEYGAVRKAWAALAEPYGPLTTAAMLALLLLVLLRVGGVGRRAAGTLSGRGLRPLAALSYSAYLSHMTALFFVLRYATPDALYADCDLGAARLAGLVAAFLAVSYVAAAAQRALLERPLQWLAARVGALAASAVRTGGRGAARAPRLVGR